MTYTINKITQLVAMIITASLLLPASLLAADTAGQMAILPFEIHAPADLNYLKDGIRDMLASRLAGNSGVEIIANNQVAQALQELATTNKQHDYPALATKLTANYLITGSITSIGGGLSLDVKVHDLSKSADSATSFYATARENSAIIGAIDSLALDIAAKIFAPKDGMQAAASVPAPATSSTTPPEEAQYQTVHPDREFKILAPIPASIPAVQAAPAPSLVSSAPGTMQMVMPKFVKSNNFTLAATAMDAGDIDGDGIDEVVVAEKSKIHVYRRNGQSFTEMGTISIPARFTIHQISLANLNVSPGSEIYISAADNQAPHSFAAEWNSDKFTIFIKDANWYLKTLNLPGKGMTLAGQTATLNVALAAGVYQLKVADGKLEQGAKIDLPRGVNLFDFAIADINNDGENEIIATDQNDRLLVIKENGKLLWRSTERYGGATRYIGGARDEEIFADNTADDQEFRYYISPRIIVKDVNNDGQADIIINRNYSTASRLFSRSKSYPDGDISVLSWNGISLAKLWSTGKIDGYIADYQLRPAPAGQSADKLFVTIVLQGGWLSKRGSDESTVLMFDLK